MVQAHYARWGIFEFHGFQSHHFMYLYLALNGSLYANTSSMYLKSIVQILYIYISGCQKGRDLQIHL